MAAPRILVVGAGIAGLAAARELAGAGLSVEAEGASHGARQILTAS
jgi:uncharacterized protein with NAD-binding domain and iron-sulfur cluster